MWLQDCTIAPPNIGLEAQKPPETAPKACQEAQRWANLFFLKQIRPGRMTSRPTGPGVAPRSQVPCAAVHCRCPPGAAGKDCALQRARLKAAAEAEAAQES